MKADRADRQSLLTLPVTIARKNIRISPTGHGYLFLAVLAVMLLGSINYNNNLGFLLSFLLGGMAAVSIFNTYNNLSGLLLFSVTTKPVFADEKVVFEVQVQASSRRGIAFEFLNQAETVQDLEAEKTHRVAIQAQATQRGMFRPGPLSISTRYPLGLFQSVARLNLDFNCLVYPKPISGPFQSGSASVSSRQERGNDERPGVEDFQGLRSYQPGDPLQHIYWKAFSREQGLYVKGFAEQKGDAVMLDFNSIQSANTEHILSRLCDMILKAQRFNVFYGLRLPGTKIPPNRGNSHRRTCLKALALFGTPSKAG